MAMANNKTLCFKCNEDKITYPCKGCSNEFCFTDLAEHKQILNDELHIIIHEYNEFKQRINEQKQNPQNDLLMKQINQWETDSIEIIQQKAKDCREAVIKLLQKFINDIEKKFNDLSEQIKQIHKENEFNEINLSYLTNQLVEITEELNNPSKISVKEDSQSCINEISIILSKKPEFNKWKQNAITVAIGNGRGQGSNQLNWPARIFIDKKKSIFIADSENHRIIEWKCNAKEGQIIAGGNGQGHRMDQLNWPTDMIVDQQNHSIIIADLGNRRVLRWLNQNRNQKIIIENIDCCCLAMDKHGFLYVSDRSMNTVRRWKMGEYNNEGIVVAGGNGIGDQLNQLNYPRFIFVDKEQSVYVSDQNNHRVMKWKKDAKEGTIVAGGNGRGGNLNQLSCPQGVIVDDVGKEEGEIVVGGNGRGNQSNQLNGPRGLSFDDEGNLYVADWSNHRIEKYSGIAKLPNDFETSDIVLRRDGQVIYAVFDNSYHIGAFCTSLGQSQGCTDRLLAWPDASLATKKSQFEGMIYNPVDDTLIFIDLKDATPIRALESCMINWNFTSDNKGIEGLEFVSHTTSARTYLLALCEANDCNDQSKPDNKGRILVLEKEKATFNNSCSWEHVGTLYLPSSVHFQDDSAISIQYQHLTRFPTYIAVSSQEMSQIWVGRIEEISKAPFFSITSLQNNIIYDLPRFPKTAKTCTIQYCNIEGITWQDNNQIILASDAAKDDQPTLCTNKEQSVHYFSFPQNLLN
ncbi:unnamed protein product [Adineta steineri]|uniref:NHL repeat containing protein n=1 Tax=Adineta steineri TaxID=433720 RepID=A0A819Q9S1_9BILA|nr:unnamed protein product [Adineta steineri]CAF4025227.1 unnamed protein product [Adineta steineri]